ncbi:hypothetical protein Pint_06450 [Pistacia integerrima]|uniref:Uncharacterized protein n=1 Tax=Pistacia integerrima TaxID=434235 RepID=A0ACC0Z3A7_9ROSI|nr:hypothetical protein Pint_06450 [Pistacia integerrima]
MEAKDTLFMKKGDGESSYVQSSFFTQRLASISKPVVQRAVDSLFHENLLPYKALNVADLGCSAGPNTFTLMETIIESVKSKCEELNCQLPEFQFYLNDLPVNDFNTLFKGSSSFVERYKDVSCFVMGAPGSFHGRLFPTNTLHLLHSSYSVHWLSKAPRLVDKDGLPLNKGKIYISKTSPPGVKEAYLAQFQQDFGLFLQSRSQEMIADGRVVLILHGRQSSDATSKENNFDWELLAEAIGNMVSLVNAKSSKLIFRYLNKS